MGFHVFGKDDTVIQMVVNTVFAVFQYCAVFSMELFAMGNCQYALLSSNFEITFLLASFWWGPLALGTG